MDIRKVVEEGKAIIGAEKTLKEIRNGKISKVFLTSNCSEEIANEIKSLKEIGKFEIEELKETNEELAAMCKKPFKISILSIKKEEK